MFDITDDTLSVDDISQTARQITAECGIDRACDMVEAFHDKNDVSQRVSLNEFLASGVVEYASEDLLLDIAETLNTESKVVLTLMRESGDPRLLRAHLMLEELAEALEALAVRDEVKLLDALADSFYVLAGTAVTFDMPLGAAFIEVHRSNMTKTRQPSDPDSQRLRDKGPDYVPADLGRVLQEYREEQRERDENADDQDT